jgi:hypothetical protein
MMWTVTMTLYGDLKIYNPLNNHFIDLLLTNLLTISLQVVTGLALLMSRLGHHHVITLYV